MRTFEDSLFYARLRHTAKKLLGKRTVAPPSGVADAGWYDRAYQAIPEYAVQFWHSHYYSIWTVLVDRIRQGRLRRVVDIGCGPGQFAACLFELAGITDYDGLDFSTQAITMARDMCPQGRFHVGDATTTTLCHDTPHDVVVCMEILEHVPDDAAVIRQWQPGIRAICTVPNFDYYSHVRFFRTAAEVEGRYGHLFDHLDVFPLRGHHADRNVFYVMDGVRNDR